MTIEKIPIFVLAIVMLFAFADGQSASEPAVPSDADIRQILVDRIDLQHQSVGIVVGVISPEERRVIAYGHLEKGDSRPLNGDTIFEIGGQNQLSGYARLTGHFPKFVGSIQPSAAIFRPVARKHLPIA